MDLRDAFFDSLFELIKDDENFYFLMGDMWAFSLTKYKEHLGDRFINVGIAEQNMISVAAGLAMSGKKVCVYSITPFVTERCFEQIKVDLCIANLPVMILGIGSGFTYSNDGPTHHTLYDISIMRSIPNMTVYSTSTPYINMHVAKMAYENSGPSYIRLDKGDVPELHSAMSVHNSSGVYCDMDYGHCDMIIITTGSIIYEVDEAAKFLRSQKGRNVSVVDVYKIKPLNNNKLVKLLSFFDNIVVVEEGSPIGGLGSIVSELMVDNNIHKPLLKISLEDKFYTEYGDRDWVRNKSEIDSKSIIEKIIEKYGDNG